MFRSTYAEMMEKVVMNKFMNNRMKSFSDLPPMLDRDGYTSLIP